MNYLSIDLWDKLCWIAYTNMWIIFTSNSISRFKLVNEIKTIILEKDISKIIVGLPYDLYWKNTKQLDKTKKFIQKLKVIFPNIQIEWIDERYTTFEALDILKTLKQKDIKNKKDSMSAYLILESYISTQK